MRFAIYNGKHKVKVLGTEYCDVIMEDLYHIEFENGSSILCSDDELEFLD